jgi:hypothetical protein
MIMPVYRPAFFMGIFDFFNSEKLFQESTVLLLTEVGGI